MVFTEEILKGLINGGYDKAVREDKETFIAFYAYLFGRDNLCESCPQKLRGYWDRLCNEGIDKLNKMNVMAKKEQNTQEELITNEQISELGSEVTPSSEGEQSVKEVDSNEPCKFRLRAGITSLAMDFGSGEFFNNDTLTNEIAVRYLKINPNRIANFDLCPENWKELIK